MAAELGKDKNWEKEQVRAFTALAAMNTLRDPDPEEKNEPIKTIK
jgi:hypothetical protein